MGTLYHTKQLPEMKGRRFVTTRNGSEEKGGKAGSKEGRRKGGKGEGRTANTAGNNARGKREVGGEREGKEKDHTNQPGRKGRKGRHSGAEQPRVGT